MKTGLTRGDILSPEAYDAVRADKRQEVREAMRHRRVAVGPFANFIFETYASMWLQVHEMLRIEKGGGAQLADELSAYNPLIPKGADLAATLMFEIADGNRRNAKLSKLGGIEDTIRLGFGGFEVAAVADDDIERTNDRGKTSAVHFLHFPFTAGQVAAFVTGEGDVTLGFRHPGYRHATVLLPESRSALAGDFAVNS